MAAVPYLILKESYVIQRIMLDLDASPDYVYPFPHDVMMQDVTQSVSIGDWYEEAEGIFYRPINALPPDVPEELQPLPPDVPEELQP